MKKVRFNLIFGLVCLAGILFMPGCEKQLNHETGFLTGIITIGPICPVQSIPPNPDCLPTAETYKAYPVDVYSSDGIKKVARISPALDGTFKTELAPGDYLVVLEPNQNRTGSSNLPVGVSVISSGETVLNINIDTGIR
jgi:hypothetical protein